MLAGSSGGAAPPKGGIPSAGGVRLGDDEQDNAATLGGQARHGAQATHGKAPDAQGYVPHDDGKQDERHRSLDADKDFALARHPIAQAARARREFAARQRVTSLHTQNNSRAVLSKHALDAGDSPAHVGRVQCRSSRSTTSRWRIQDRSAWGCIALHRVRATDHSRIVVVDPLVSAHAHVHVVIVIYILFSSGFTAECHRSCGRCCLQLLVVQTCSGVSLLADCGSRAL